MRVCLCVQEGGEMSVYLCACLSGRFMGGGGWVGVFRNKLGVKGRRVGWDRMGELRGRSVWAKREEAGCGGGGFGDEGSSTHSLTLSVTVWRFHT